MGHVFITRAIPGTAVAQLEAAGHTVEVWPGELPPPPDALAAALARSDAAMTMVVDRITPAMLAGAPRLRIVANMAVGYDNIDPAAAAEAGVWVTNTPGVLAETTADLAFALLLAAARRVVEADRDTRAGGWKTWSPTAFLGTDLFGATLGIVGLGEIGEAVARRARGFRMRILYHSRTRKPALEADLGLEFCDLHSLLAGSDFVSLHTPLTPETRHLLGPAAFAAMKPGAILVNTARGGIVDQDALVEALRSGRLGGAALDVTEPEPLPLTHPLYSFPNVIITPHIGSASRATRARMAEMAAANILAVLEGREPPNPVNRPPRPRG
ncbi:2-hydroxyacid dehydrogenase [Tepidiforma thermophila]|uniref:Glyoxylate reductase n=1 Tax=Tepidiforma thermophila (strain KCTC 52669 / CGMCC 1.13589 / G233) TaxID=2761530 RepID=A0A2A9HK66_TEPT2|nr:D-glycerate dehydrogenase [Tepidiforma thermophila]PFG75376.1 glyoxylate reductase [Tepidiforma thermophila]